MIDAHCHLQDPQIPQTRIAEIIAEGIAAGIQTWVVNGTRESDWPRVAELADRYPEHILPSFGLHPWYVSERTSEWQDSLIDYLDRYPAAGVGEIGLDRWVRGHDIAEQLPLFQQQWRLAVEWQRPITVHCLKAWGHLDQALSDLPASAYLLHSYSGPVEMIDRWVQSGAYFSISGYFLKPEKAAKLATFSHIPEERILLETDAPAMPLPSELDRYSAEEYNHPANLAVVYERTDYAAETVAANFQRWYLSS